MEFYKIVIILVVVYIIIYNLTLGFSLFTEKTTITVYDCDPDDIPKIGFRSLLNRYPSNSINMEYDKDTRELVIKEALDLMLITGIAGVKRVKINNIVYAGITDSILISKFPMVDLLIEGEFKKQEIFGLYENTILTFPIKKNVFRMKESKDEDYLYIFKDEKITDLTIIFIDTDKQPSFFKKFGIPFT